MSCPRTSSASQSDHLQRMATDYSSPLMVKNLLTSLQEGWPELKPKLERLRTCAGFQLLSVGEQIEVLESVRGARSRGPMLDKLPDLLWITSGYHKLTAGHRRVALTSMTRSTNPGVTVKQLVGLMSDRPFSRATDAMKTRALANPSYYGKRTMQALASRAARLPDEAGFKENVRKYRQGARQRIVNFNRVSKIAVEKVVANRTQFRAYFLDHWYEPAANGKTVGEAYRRLPGGCWVSKLDSAIRYWRSFVAREVVEKSTGRDTLVYGSRYDICEK